MTEKQLMKKKHIVFATDDNYVQHLGVALRSLLVNNKDSSFVIHILNNGVTQKNKERLEEICDDDECRIEFLDVKDSAFDSEESGRWGKAMYYRLLIPELIHEQKVLYLDVDIIVNRSIDALYDQNIDEEYAAAVEDLWADPVRRERLKMHPDSRYFNSGVMLINVKKWREDNIPEQIRDFLSSHHETLESPDQDALNAVIDGKWKRLPLKYNQYDKHTGKDSKAFSASFTAKELGEAGAAPVIIHYVGGRKPWHYRCEHPKKDLYWKYLGMTPFKGYLPKDVTFRNMVSKNTPKILKNPLRYVKKGSSS